MRSKLLFMALLLSATTISLHARAQVSVAVSSPANNATVSSPVKIAATATSSLNIDGWRVYVDSVSSYQGGSTKYISPSLTLSPGTHKIVVRAWAVNGTYGSAYLTVNVASAPAITPIKVTTTTLPAGQYNQGYSAQLSASGGTPPYVWSIASGQLPPGLSLSAGGLITGTPTTAGTSYFSVTARDSAASRQAATSALSIAVNSSTAPVYLWRDDVETGNLGKWYYPSTSATGNYGGGIYNSGVASATASRDVAHSGSYSAKATITTPSSPTSAVRLFRWQEAHANRELYYSIWVYVPSRYFLTANANTGRFWNLFQFKSSTTDKSRNDPVWAFYVDDTSNGLYVSAGWGAGGTTLAGPYSTSGVALKSYKQTAAPVPVGRWVHYQAFLRESNGFDGRLTLWQDGVKLFDFQNVRTSYNNCSFNSWCADNAWSVNLYSDGMSPNPATVYFDDAAISKTYIP